jgi:hypothetical protein
VVGVVPEIVPALRVAAVEEWEWKRVEELVVSKSKKEKALVVSKYLPPGAPAPQPPLHVCGAPKLG